MTADQEPVQIFRVVTEPSTPEPAKPRAAVVVDEHPKRAEHITARAVIEPPGSDQQVRPTSSQSPAAKDRLAAARALIRPQPAPTRKANQIFFEQDDTPADAEDRLRQPPAVVPTPRPRPGPVPRSASPERQAEDVAVRATRAAISPYSTLAKAAQASSASASPTLTVDELEAVIEVIVQRYGAILDIQQASEVSKLAKQTLRERVCYGQYADSVIRGRPLRFWTHRFVKAVMTP